MMSSRDMTFKVVHRKLGEKDVKCVLLNDLILAGTIDKSDEFYEGYISGFKRAVAMYEDKSSLMYKGGVYNGNTK